MYIINILNLTNFNNSLVNRIGFMFQDCSSLTSLDLSYFDTSLVTDMGFMFQRCSSLTSLDLSNFNTSLVTTMLLMFIECVNLEYINLYNFDESKINQLKYDNGPHNLVIWIKTISENTLNDLKTDKNCLVIDCSEDWKSKQQKIYNNNQCIESCDKSSQDKYEYNGQCVENCPNGNLYDDNNIINICKCHLDKCLLCPQIALNKELCTKCNNNCYPKENDPLNFGEYFNCYNEKPEGYYLDNNIYKKCYQSCKTCNIEGNSINYNYITCNENFLIEKRINDNLNCYENSTIFFDDYSDIENENSILSTMELTYSDKYTSSQLINFPSTMILSLSYSNEYFESNEKKTEYIAYFDMEIIKDILKNERNETLEIKYYDNILKNI